MAELIQTGENRYQPDSKHTFDNHPGYTINQQTLASLVGVVAFGLPFILLFGTIWTCHYYSISHFYYSQFLGGVFIAALAFIATFLIAYRGETPTESQLATFAGISALGVALFPTSGRGCDLTAYSGRPFVDFELQQGSTFLTLLKQTEGIPYFQLFPYASTIHFLSAAILFLFLAYYSFYIFTRVVPEKHRINGDRNAELTPQKKRRNQFYRMNGYIILGCIVIMAANALYEYIFDSDTYNPDIVSFWDQHKLTFWFESIALWAFGSSWIAKGRGFGFIGYIMDDRDRELRR